MVPISYDIQQLKLAIHGILFNSVPFLGSCCSLVDSQAPIPGICDSLNAAGIMDSSDVNDAGDLVAFLGAFSGGSDPSIGGVKAGLYGINANIGTLSSIGCTNGVGEICYAFDSIPSNHKFFAITTATSAQELSVENKLLLSPNPASDYVNLYIELKDDTDISLEIYSMDGQMMTQQSFGRTSAKKELIDTRNFDNGLYLFKINVGNEFVTKRILINRF